MEKRIVNSINKWQEVEINKHRFYNLDLDRAGRLGSNGTGFDCKTQRVGEFSALARLVDHPQQECCAFNE